MAYKKIPMWDFHSFWGGIFWGAVQVLLQTMTISGGK